MHPNAFSKWLGKANPKLVRELICGKVVCNPYIADALGGCPSQSPFTSQRCAGKCCFLLSLLLVQKLALSGGVKSPGFVAFVAFHDANAPIMANSMP